MFVDYQFFLPQILWRRCSSSFSRFGSYMLCFYEVCYFWFAATVSMFIRVLSFHFYQFFLCILHLVLHLAACWLRCFFGVQIGWIGCFSSLKRNHWLDEICSLGYLLGLFRS
jgi:hypothetical protein